MNNNLSNIKANFLTAIGGDHTATTASFVALGSKTTKPAYIVAIGSSYNVSAWLSIDGTNNQIFVPAGGFPLNLAACGIFLPAGTQFYIKQGPDGAASSGDLFITLVYADN